MRTIYDTLEDDGDAAWIEEFLEVGLERNLEILRDNLVIVEMLSTDPSPEQYRDWLRFYFGTGRRIATRASQNMDECMEIARRKIRIARIVIGWLS